MVGHPLTAPVLKLVAFMKAKASRFFELREADGHPANMKVHAHLQNTETEQALREDRDESLSVLHHCGNHATNLVVISTVQLVGLMLINSMY